MSKYDPTAMLTAPVESVLLRMTIPVIWGLLAVIGITLVDTYFIGQLGVLPLAAVSFTFPVVFCVLSISFGVSIGTSSYIAHLMGANDWLRMQRACLHALMLAFTSMAIVSLAGILTIEPLFRMLGANDETMPYIIDYMSIWYLSAPLLSIPMSGNSVIRAGGDSKTPSILMIISTILNAVLDPLLMYGWGPLPALGVRGIALASALAYGLILVLNIMLLRKREMLMPLSVPGPSALPGALLSLWYNWKAIIYVGGPAALTSIMMPLMIAGQTRFLASFGNDVVAAFGVGSRIQQFSLMGIVAFSTILTPFIGQNIGAGNYQRLHDSMAYATRYAIIWGLGVGGILMVTAYPVAALFSHSAVVQEHIRLYLWMTPLYLPFIGLSFLANACCNGLRLPMEATGIIAGRLAVFVLPASLVGGWLFQFAGLLWGMALAEMLAGIIGIVWVKRRAVRRGILHHERMLRS